MNSTRREKTITTAPELSLQPVETPQCLLICLPTKRSPAPNSRRPTLGVNSPKGRCSPTRRIRTANFWWRGMRMTMAPCCILASGSRLNTGTRSQGFTTPPDVYSRFGGLCEKEAGRTQGGVPGGKDYHSSDRHDGAMPPGLRSRKETGLG